MKETVVNAKNKLDVEVGLNKERSERSVKAKSEISPSDLIAQKKKLKLTTTIDETKLKPIFTPKYFQSNDCE